ALGRGLPGSTTGGTCPRRRGAVGTGRGVGAARAGRAGSAPVLRRRCGRPTALLGTVLALRLDALTTLHRALGLSRLREQLLDGHTLALRLALQLGALTLLVLPLRLRTGRRHATDRVELLAHGPQVRREPVDEHADREVDAGEGEHERQ